MHHESKAESVDISAITAAITEDVMTKVAVEFEICEQRLESIIVTQEERVGRRTLSPVLTVQEVAKRMKVSVRTVSTWIGENTLAHFKKGRVVRIQLADLHEFWGKHYLLGRQNRRRGLW